MVAQLIQPMREEVRDLVFVVAISVLVPVVWFVALGWRGEMLGGHDSTLYFLFLRDLVAHHGNHHQASYTPGILGGISLTGVYGAAPSFVIGAKLGLSAIGTFNLAIIVSQVCQAVLGAYACVDLAAIF